MRSCVLTYHSLDSSGSVISIRPEAFRAHMECLVKRRIPVVPLHQIRETPGAVAITFDDGFENFHEHAFPILATHRLPATVFVVTGACGKLNEWGQPSAAIPRLRLMDWSQLEAIVRGGIALGAHTVTHPRLDVLSVSGIHCELDRCRHEIEQRTGSPVRTLAYPYGKSDERVRECARQRFQCSYGTRFAPISPSCDMADLPRLDMFYFRSQHWFESLWTWRGGAYVSTRGFIRRMRESIVDREVRRHHE